jgi:DNA invertase Pin-like site-specific DNA recombinase
VEYVTAEEIASAFHVDVSTVYRWGRTNKIPSKVIAGTVRFPRSLLELDPSATAGVIASIASQE